MTGRSRYLSAMLAVLLIGFALAISGCANGQGAFFSRMEDGRLQHMEGSDVWIWDRKGGTAQITLNDKLFAVIQNGMAQFALSEGRSVDVVTDGNGTPLSVRAAYNTILDHSDYDLMNVAFGVHKKAGGQAQPSSLGWVIFLLIIIIAGVLLFLYAGRLVNSWKLGGIFNGHDTAKSLLLFKAAGALLAIIGFIILLTVIF